MTFKTSTTDNSHLPGGRLVHLYCEVGVPGETITLCNQPFNIFCYFLDMLFFTTFLASFEFEYKQLFVIELKFHYKVAAMRNAKNLQKACSEPCPLSPGWKFHNCNCIYIMSLLYLEMQFRHGKNSEMQPKPTQSWVDILKE